MKKMMTVLVTLSMMAVMTACGSKPTEQPSIGTQEVTNGKLIMATNAEFPPYEFREGDKIVGIDAEIASAIAEELNMELVIENMAFDSIVASVVSGKADFGMAGMTVTEDRLASVNFSDSYTQAAQVIIVKEDSLVASPEDLTGKKVGVQLGTTGDIYCDDIENATIERYSKGIEAVQALKQGKVDAVVIDREPAKVFVQENEGLIVLDEAFTVEDYAIAISKDNTELLDQINSALSKLESSGKIAEIKAKYITVE